jgi:hypothetical protein
MRWMICIRLALILLITIAACRVKISVPESYHVDAYPSPLTRPYTQGTPIQVAAGEKQDVAITVRYLRGEQPTAKLKYSVEFSAPGELTVSPTNWDVEQDLTRNDTGFNYSMLMTVGVAADAEPGEREVKVTIRPATGATSVSAVRFQVVNRGGKGYQGKDALSLRAAWRE